MNLNFPSDHRKIRAKAILNNHKKSGLTLTNTHMSQLKDEEEISKYRETIRNAI